MYGTRLVTNWNHITLFCVLAMLCPARRLIAQECESLPLAAPTAAASHSLGGGYTVWEGPVAPDPVPNGTANGLFRGQDGSVAVDAAVPAHFIVAWKAAKCYMHDSVDETYSPILLNRFSAEDGHCLTWGANRGPKAASGRQDRKSTRLNSSHLGRSRMPSSA